MRIRQSGIAKLHANVYRVNVCAAVPLKVLFVLFVAFIVRSTSKSMMQDFSPPGLSTSFEWLIRGIMSIMLKHQVISATILDMKGVRHFGEDIGWHTAMYLQYQILF